MVDFRGWNRLLSIRESVYYDVTLKMHSIFEVGSSPIGFIRLRAIHLKHFREPKRLSYKEYINMAIRF